MHDTPSTRTSSKNATSRKRNSRKAQLEHSLAQTPVATLPDSVPMHSLPPPPPPVNDPLENDDEKRGFVIDSPQLDLVQIRDEDDLGVSTQTPGGIGVDESGADGSADDLVDLEFNPFAVVAKDTPLELTEPTMPQVIPEQPATATPQYSDEPPERTGPRSSALLDTAEAIRIGEPVRAQQEPPSEVTSLNSPPASPPPSSGRTRAPILVSRYVLSHYYPFTILKCVSLAIPRPLLHSPANFTMSRHCCRLPRNWGSPARSLILQHQEYRTSQSADQASITLLPGRQQTPL